MQILLAYASLSGNTREVARLLAAHCQARGHALHCVDVDSADALPALARPRDLLLLGCWTDSAGRTPAEMKRFVAALRDGPGLPPGDRLAVFGTGETQWGMEVYCGAAHRLARFFASAYPVLAIEQMPHGVVDTHTIHHWADATLAHFEGLHDVDPACRHA
ncbi:flavodoxin [Stenotrophomonas sp.]|uniref:flavodoxin n=1 Tax=Stenotrophomonas sp. TaxID=69392 RepID=UPI002FCC0623